MKTFWVANDSLYKILSLKTLILCLGIVIAIVFVSLAMSDYITTAGPAWHDLFRDQIYRGFLQSLYYTAQTLLIPFIVIIATLAANGMFRGGAEHIYLTGGLSRPTAFLGRILGLVIFILLLWWVLFALAGATLLITGLGNITLSMVYVFIKLSINSIALSLLAYALVGLSKTALLGFVPVLANQFWLTINSNATVETAGKGLHNIINYILPLNTFTLFQSSSVEDFDLLKAFDSDAPLHGAMWLVVFILFFFLIAIGLYIANQDQ